MQFFSPEYFLGLWLVPAVMAFYYLAHKLRQKRLHRIVQDEALLAKLIEGYRKNEWKVRSILMTLTVLCLILALAVARGTRDVLVVDHFGGLTIMLVFMAFQVFFFGLLAEIINKK